MKKMIIGMVAIVLTFVIVFFIVLSIDLHVTWQAVIGIVLWAAAFFGLNRIGNHL